MLLWSYAVAKPKDCPPGWELPRRMERLSNEKKAKSFEDDMDDVDFVTFLKLEDGSSSQSKIKSSYDMQYKSNIQKQYQSITSCLFDTIAFCQGEGAAVEKVSVKTSECMTMLRNSTWNELSYAVRCIWYK